MTEKLGITPRAYNPGPDISGEVEYNEPQASKGI